MDFVFNSGDNYFSGASTSTFVEMFKLSLPAVLGFASALLVSWLAFQRERRRQETKARGDLESYAQFYFATVNELKEPSIRQCKSLLVTVDQLAQKGDLPFVLQSQTDFDFTRLQAMDQMSLFKALVLSKSDTSAASKAFSSASGQIGYLITAKKEIHVLFHELNSAHRLHQDRWNQHLKPIQEHILRWYVREEGHSAPQSGSELVMRLMRLQHSVFQPDNGVPNPEMGSLCASYIDPLYVILNDYPNDERCHDLASHAMECKYAYNNLLNAREQTRVAFQGYADGIEKAVTKLEQAVHMLRSEPVSKGHP